jgi:hypothetical protein
VRVNVFSLRTVDQEVRTLIGGALSADSYEAGEEKVTEMNQEFLEVQSIPMPVLAIRAAPAPRRACGRECRICMGEHDAEIHRATVEVHAWYRWEVTKYFDVAPIEV